MSRTRWCDVGAVALAVGISSAVALVSCSVEEANHPTNPPNVRLEPPATIENRPMALFIGDSYTAGNSSAEMSYGCRAAVEMGWLCGLSAFGNTGYVSGGSANRWKDPYTGESSSYSERIPHLAAQYDPAVVVLDGGRNDDFVSRKYAYDAMLLTIKEARRAWPRARIVVIRPRLLANPSDNAGMSDEFMERLLAEPGAQGVIFVDPIGSLAHTDTSELLAADGIHPNRLGEQRMTEALVESLRRHQMGSSP